MSLTTKLLQYAPPYTKSLDTTYSMQVRLALLHIVILLQNC